jgi:GNAT superfamily N-acetyltransferase
LIYQVRKATRADRSNLERLIARSARALGARHYRPEQTEAALRGAFGVDTQLIDDGRYFVIELERKILGCGGWSCRRTLFRGDAHAQRDAHELDFALDVAKIRASFVDSAYARRGIGRARLGRCEAEARAQGFTRFELMRTLSGVPLYQGLGYKPGERLRYPLAAKVTMEFVPMRKEIRG